MRTRPHWFMGVPNWELADLRVTEGIRPFFPIHPAMAQVRQESKEGAYLAAFGLLRKYGGMV